MLPNHIEETNTLSERLQHDLAANPQRTSLMLALESLSRRRAKLQAVLSATVAINLKNTEATSH